MMRLTFSSLDFTISRSSSAILVRYLYLFVSSVEATLPGQVMFVLRIVPLLRLMLVMTSRSLKRGRPRSFCASPGRTASRQDRTAGRPDRALPDRSCPRSHPRVRAVPSHVARSRAPPSPCSSETSECRAPA
uniref:Putative secreted protein n=1 Tax=Anopheles darlingi TaxID=43151 RepID=A0A2M4DDF3_ANODA